MFTWSFLFLSFRLGNVLCWDCVSTDQRFDQTGVGGVVKWEGRGAKKVSECSPLYGGLKVSLVVCFLMDAYGMAF